MKSKMKHSDMPMDKKVVKAAVHKHEAAMHPGKPKTKLAKGGMVDGKKTSRGGGISRVSANTFNDA